MTIPRHINPTEEHRRATAPYNFVPLPEKVIFVDDEEDFSVIDETGTEGPKKLWATHDRYVRDTYSGYIDLKIWTLSPLFIRGPRRKRNEKWDDREARERPEPAANHNGKAIIPGSSLRGMIRNLYEIITFSKIQPVTNDKLFYRSVSRDRIGKVYGPNFSRDLGRIRLGKRLDGTPSTVPAKVFGNGVRAGILKGDRGNWTVEECNYARVDHAEIRAGMAVTDIHTVFPKTQTLVPNSVLQFADAYVDVDQSPEHYYFPERTKTRPDGSVQIVREKMYLRFRNVRSIATTPATGLVAGKLVITGHVARKHFEFVFLVDAQIGTINVKDEVIERFNTDDQLTQWQKWAHGGPIKSGDPVFFLTDPNDASKIVFLGRAGMFRLPYDYAPFDLLSDDHKYTKPDRPEIDMAEALFGRIVKNRTKKKESFPQIKGRLEFEDAISLLKWEELRVRNGIEETTLLSPHPSSYPNYLTQNGAHGEKDLYTYLDMDRVNTTIRGHKLYWHQDQVHGIEQAAADENTDDRMASRLTPIFVPENNGSAFAGRIRFANLSKIELGALLWALDLDQGCAHKIGFAKAKGLGSIRVEAELHALDHEARRSHYSGWNAASDSSAVSKDDAKEAFTNWLVGRLPSREPRVDGKEGLRSIARLDALFLMLTRGATTDTYEMGLDERELESGVVVRGFKERPVLPTPHWLAANNADPWAVVRRSVGPAPGDPLAKYANLLPPDPRPLKSGQRRKALFVKNENDEWIAFVRDNTGVTMCEVFEPKKLPKKSKTLSVVDVAVKVIGLGKSRTVQVQYGR